MRDASVHIERGISERMLVPVTKSSKKCNSGDDDICIANTDGPGTRLDLWEMVGGDTGGDIEPEWSP